MSPFGRISRRTASITRLRRVTMFNVKTHYRNSAVSRAILLCLGYGLYSLFATWFPVVVSQYCVHAQLRSHPRRSGRAPLTHPAPSRYLSTAWRYRSLMDVSQPRYHRESVSEYGRCSFWITYWPGRLPCTDITRLHSIRLVAGLQRYYAAIRLPDGHLPSSLIRLVGHTRSCMTGVS